MKKNAEKEYIEPEILSKEGENFKISKTDEQFFDFKTQIFSKRNIIFFIPKILTVLFFLFIFFWLIFILFDNPFDYIISFIFLFFLIRFIFRVLKLFWIKK